MCNYQTYLSIINETLQILGLIVGGVWAIYHYLKFRKSKPKLNTDNAITIISSNGDNVLLRIEIELRNIGEVPITGIDGKVSVCDFGSLKQLDVKKLNANKLPENISIYDLKISEFDYVPQLIEPGEIDKMHKIISLGKTINVIEIHSHIKNLKYKPKGRINSNSQLSNIGWSKSSIHHLNL